MGRRGQDPRVARGPPGLRRHRAHDTTAACTASPFRAAGLAAAATTAKATHDGNGEPKGDDDGGHPGQPLQGRHRQGRATARTSPGGATETTTRRRFRGVHQDAGGQGGGRGRGAKEARSGGARPRQRDALGEVRVSLYLAGVPRREGRGRQGEGQAKGKMPMGSK